MWSPARSGENSQTAAGGFTVIGFWLWAQVLTDSALSTNVFIGLRGGFMNEVMEDELARLEVHAGVYSVIFWIVIC